MRGMYASVRSGADYFSKSVVEDIGDIEMAGSAFVGPAIRSAMVQSCFFIVSPVVKGLQFIQPDLAQNFKIIGVIVIDVFLQFQLFQNFE